LKEAHLGKRKLAKQTFKEGHTIIWTQAENLHFESHHIL
jgi:hypothetical protein